MRARSPAPWKDQTRLGLWCGMWTRHLSRKLRFGITKAPLWYHESSALVSRKLCVGITKTQLWIYRRWELDTLTSYCPALSQSVPQSHDSAATFDPRELYT